MTPARTAGTRRLIASLLGTTLCVSIVLAQQSPGPPKNLRILTAESRQIPDRRTAQLGQPGPHGYFEYMASRPEVFRTFSLRSQEELATYAQSAKKPLAVTYDPANDPDPRRQDAAKVVIPEGGNSLPNQVRLPIEVSDGSILVTWDVWFGKEFRFPNHGIVNYKTFQFASDGIWSEIRSRFKRADGQSAVALVDGRAYAARPTAGRALGPNVTRGAPLSPQLSEFAIEPETWTRYWAFYERTPEWDLYSLWMADENHDPVRLFDRLQLKYRGDLLESFWVEFNTSTNEKMEGRGPLVAYVRNVVMLKNVEDPTRLFEKPRSK